MPTADRQPNRGEAARAVARQSLRASLAAPLLVAGLLCAGCDTAAKPSPPLLLVASGDTSGWIVPCGCTSNQSGGLARRGSYLKLRQSAATLIYVDVGGANSGSQEYDVAKLEAILTGEQTMGLVAHNLGAAEAALGADEVRRLLREKNVPFISANVFDSEDQPVAPAFALVEKGGRRILLIGVLSPSLATAGLKIQPPQASVLRALRETEGKRDFAIVLAYLPEKELRELAKSLPEVDAVVGGPTGQAMAPLRVGPVLLASATNKGKFVVEMEIPSPGASAKLAGKVIELNEQFGDDDAQQENLAAFYRLLAVKDFSPEQTSFVPPSSNLAPLLAHFADANSCRDCHEEDCQSWAASAHAHAWQTLEKTGSHVDSYCQQCHTTGYGLAGGFASPQRTANRVNVNCQSCHGPSQKHVEDSSVPTAYVGQAAAKCVACHDRENSPEFDYEIYWKKIEHGPTAASRRQPRATSAAQSVQGAGP